MEQQNIVIKNKIRQNYAEWKDEKDENIIVQRMVGITNQTYKVSIKDAQKRALIYRKFGPSAQNIFLQRQNQIYIYRLISQSGCGPQVYYYDQQIRIQQFLQSKVLPSSDMISNSGYMQKVAFTLRKFHEIKPNQTLVRQSLFKRKFIDQAQQLIAICQNKLSKDIYQANQKQFVQILKKWVCLDQIKSMEQLCKKHDGELVFSHHDLLANNILIQTKTDNIIFIDYQYAGFNYRIADIANYFNQTTFNYQVSQPPYFQYQPIQPHHYPQFQKFIHVYSVAQDYATYQKLHENFQKVKDDQKYLSEKQRLMKSLPLGFMLSDLLWCWWGIIVSKNPNIQFNYIQFVKQRYFHYQKIKSQFKK